MSDEDTVLTSEVIDYILQGLGDGYYYKQERLSRKIMIELVKAGRAEFLLLRDDEVSKWWNDIMGSIQSKIAKHKEKMDIYELKLQAYNKLTAAERKTLGIRKPIKPKGLK